MRTLLLTLCLLPCVLLAQPPPAQDLKPIQADANGNLLPTQRNGHPLNLPAGTTLNGSAIGGGAAATIIGLDFPTGTAVRSFTAKDDFNDVDASFAAGATITSLISGTLTTYSNSASSTWTRLNRELHIYNADIDAGVTGVSMTHTTGVTPVGHFKVPATTNGDVRLGFTSSTLSGGNVISSGIIIGSVGSGIGNSSIVALNAGNVYALFTGVARPGETYGLAVKLTAGGWEGYAQGGYFERYGAKLYSDDWLKIYTSAVTVAGTIRPAFESRLNLDVILNDFTVSDSFSASDKRLAMVEQDASLYDMHMGSAVPDANGNIWYAWYKGTGDSSADGVVRVGCRLASGVRLGPTTVVTSSGATREDAGSLSLVNGAVWLTTNTTTNAFTNATPKHRTLSIASGAISVGSATAFTGVATTFALNYNQIYTINAHQVLPLNTETQFFTARSTDNGATWTEGTKYNGIEPTICQEPDGTFAAYIRTPHVTSANVPRYTSANEGSTWTVGSGAGASLSGVPSNDSRHWAVRSSGGTVFIVGSDNVTDYFRSNTTMWEIGNNGAVLSKIPLTDLTTTNQNYPAITIYNDKLTLVCPMRSNGSGVPGQVMVVEQTLDNWRTGQDRELTAKIAGYAHSGDNTDIRKLKGLSAGTAASPNLGTSTGPAINFTASLGQLVFNGLEIGKWNATNFELVKPGAAVLVPSDGAFDFQGRGSIQTPADGRFIFTKWDGTTVATLNDTVSAFRLAQAGAVIYIPDAGAYLFETRGGLATTANGSFKLVNQAGVTVDTMGGVTEADQVRYYTGVGTTALADFTAQAREFLEQETLDQQRASLELQKNVEPGVQTVLNPHSRRTTATITVDSNVATVNNEDEPQWQGFEIADDLIEIEFTGGPVDGWTTRVRVTNSDDVADHVLTIPESYSFANRGLVTSVTVPKKVGAVNGQSELTFTYDGILDLYLLVGDTGPTLVSDTAYDATSWNGVTTIAPSKNAVRDKIELLAPLASPPFTGTATAANITLSGTLITTPQALSGAGAINVTTSATAYTSTGGSEALTLANGTAGQFKTISHVVDGGSGILTPTTKAGYSTITFTNAGDSVTLQYFTTAGWCVMGSYGATIAP